MASFAIKNAGESIFSLPRDYLIVKVTSKVLDLSIYLLVGKKINGGSFTWFEWQIFCQYSIKTKKTSCLRSVYLTFLKTFIRDTPVLVTFAIHGYKMVRIPRNSWSVILPFSVKLFWWKFVDIPFDLSGIFLLLKKGILL